MACYWRETQRRLSGALLASRMSGSLGRAGGWGSGPAAAAGTGAGAAERCLQQPQQSQQCRWLSNKPENVVYSGPTAASPKRVTLRTLRDKYQRGENISMVTAYDYPSAVHVDEAGIDMLLVGDSVAMVVHGHDTTLPITLDEMLIHCRAVSRGAHRAFLVGDMPFGSVEVSPEHAVRSAVRMMKEGSMDAVKIEGGFANRVRAVHAVVEAGVAVMGHVGLTPQAISVLGGFRPAAQNAQDALRIIKEAKALEAAGCFSVVLECVPAAVAAAVTSELSIPTIGIGAGPGTSGQVLVYHDLLGMMQHPHHAKVTPKFCKQYAAVGHVIQDALAAYHADVVSGEFPSQKFSPYRIPPQEVEQLVKDLGRAGFRRALAAVERVAEQQEQQQQQQRGEVAATAGQPQPAAAAGAAS